MAGFSKRQMTNEQAPMTNRRQSNFTGHWDLVIGHSAEQLLVLGHWGFEPILLFGFFFGFGLARFAADHGDAAGADQLEDAVGPHALDEGLDLALAARDFDH